MCPDVNYKFADAYTQPLYLAHTFLLSYPSNSALIRARKGSELLSGYDVSGIAGSGKIGINTSISPPVKGNTALCFAIVPQHLITLS